MECPIIFEFKKARTTFVPIALGTVPSETFPSGDFLPGVPPSRLIFFRALSFLNQFVILDNSF